MLKKIKPHIKRTSLAVLAACVITAFQPGTAQVQVTKAASVDSLSVQAGKIVDKNVKTSDNTKIKLKKLFVYMEKNYDYARAMGFKTYDKWENDYALEMYSEKKGSCYHFAAAYAFLAKKATGCKVRVVTGKTNGFMGKLQSHAWAEVKINSAWYICDPNMDKYAADSSKKYFLKKRGSLKSVYNNFKNTKYFNASF